MKLNIYNFSIEQKIYRTNVAQRKRAKQKNFSKEPTNLPTNQNKDTSKVKHVIITSQQIVKNPFDSPVVSIVSLPVGFPQYIHSNEKCNLMLLFDDILLLTVVSISTRIFHTKFMPFRKSFWKTLLK